MFYVIGMKGTEIEYIIEKPSLDQAQATSIYNQVAYPLLTWKVHEVDSKGAVQTISKKIL